MKGSAAVRKKWQGKRQWHVAGMTILLVFFWATAWSDQPIGDSHDNPNDLEYLPRSSTITWDDADADGPRSLAELQSLYAVFAESANEPNDYYARSARSVDKNSAASDADVEQEESVDEAAAVKPRSSQWEPAEQKARVIMKDVFTAGAGLIAKPRPDGTGRAVAPAGR